MSTIKRCVTIMLLASLIFGSVPAHAASRTYCGVNIDGKAVTFDADTRPYILPDVGRAVIPLRKVAELMGAAVEWNNAERSVTFTKSGKVAKLVIGEKQYTVNGSHKAMDVAGFIENSRTYVPFRVIGEALGATVGFDDPSKTVLISTADKTSGNEVFNQIRAAFPANQTQVMSTGALLISTTGHLNLYTAEVVVGEDGLINVKQNDATTMAILAKLLPVYYPTQYQKAIDLIAGLKKDGDHSDHLTLDGRPFFVQHFGDQLDVHTNPMREIQ